MMIIPLYAAVLALLYIVLAARIIVIRRGERISLGWAGHAILEKRVRTHGNFAEYVPFALLLLAMAELRGAGAIWLHLLGVLLIAARVAHAYALSQIPPQGLQFRAFGVLATFATYLGAILLILFTI